MGHSSSRSRSTSSRRTRSISTRPSVSSSKKSFSEMTSPRSSTSPTNKPVPTYILDSLKDPDLVSDNWYALAVLEGIREEASQESLFRTPYNKPPEIARYSISQAALPENRSKNRYADIAPYDLNSVRVGEGTLEKDMYLNASWVRERAGGALWIASQAPLPKTQYEFLGLCTDITVAHKRVRTIVQLTPWVERRLQAAHPYIPNEVGESLVISRFPPPPSDADQSKARLRVTVTGKRYVSEADCVVRNIEIRYDGWPDGESPVFEVRHLAFDSWVDRGVPRTASTAYWLALLADRENRKLPRSEEGNDVDPAPPPMIVHCSAGVGRTGAFIAICSLLRAFGVLPPAARPEWDTYVPEPSVLGNALEDLPPDDHVVQEVNALREQRTRMVQMPEQLAFIYQLLAMVLSKKVEGQ